MNVWDALDKVFQEVGDVLRWVVLLTCAVACAAVVCCLWVLICRFFWLGTGFVEATSGFIFGGWFVFVAGRLAPYGKRVVACTMSGVILLLAAAGACLGYQDNVEALTGVSVGSLVACLRILRNPESRREQ